VEPLARVELGSDVPAEVLRLLPLVGLEPVIRPDRASPPALTWVDDPSRTAAPAAMRIEFVGRGQVSEDAADVSLIENRVVAPVTLTIACEATSLAENSAVDLVTDSAIATVCLILSRALGLTSPFLTADAQLFDVVRAATVVARGPAWVLVEGELGLGKESLIKLIHAASRDTVGLIHAECAGLEADAVAAEFAPLLAQAASSNSGRAGAGGGAIFFNRIGELSPAAQHNLLDLLRALAFAPPDSGDAPALSAERGRRDTARRVRVLASSTRPLAATVTGGELVPELHDLFDATFTISPLRVRRGDLPLLVRHYLRSLNPTVTLNAAAMRALSVYPFPGNVLELVNFVTRVAIVPRKAAPRRSTSGPAASAVVGRAEVISQLDRGSLNTVWRSHVPRDSRGDRTRRADAAHTAEPDGDASVAAAPSFMAPASAAAVRMTIGGVPRARKPRGGHH
jgi:hypothetical protein